MSLTTTVSADLLLRTEEGDIQITGEGRQLDVDLPSLRAGGAIMQAGPSSETRAARVAGLDDALRGVGLTVDVCLRGLPLARLGADARPGGIARLLRLGNVEVQPGKLLMASIRRHPGITAAAVGAAGLAALGFFFRRRQ